MKFQLFSRHKYVDVCPTCRMKFTDFGGLAQLKGLVFCEKCGAVKVRKEVLEKFRERKPDLLEGMWADLKCKECGKVCRSKLGLYSHMKSHAK